MKSSSHACRSDNFLTLMIIYINITLYATCYQIQRPLEPYLVEQLSKDNINAAEEYGRLQSFFSLVQTFGSLFNGYLLDILSAKTGFIISFLSSALSYYIIAQSTTMNMLYISKIPTLFQAGFLCAQLSASQATKDGNERLNAFGRLTMCYTVGMVIGPTLGGSLGLTGDYYLGAKVAVAGSLLSVGLALLMPSNHDADAKIQSENPIKINEKSSLQSTISSIFSNVWLILLTKVTTSIAIAMSSSVLPLILKDTYKFNEAWMGITMSCMSALTALVNGVLLGPITLLLGGDLITCISICLVSMTLLFGIQSFASSNFITSNVTNQMVLYIITTFGLSIFQYVMATSLTSESTSRIKKSDNGTLLGIEHALFSAARIVAPQIGIGLWKSSGVGLLAVTSSGIFFAISVMWTTLKEQCLGMTASGRSQNERKEI